MDDATIRDSAMVALIFGFFASTWFGWAQEDPPERWKRWLVIASVLSLAVAVGGGVLAWQNWASGSALSEPEAMRDYGILVGIEFGVGAIGAAVLAVTRRARWIPAWICLVVGVHFWPMAPLLDRPSLVVVGAVLVLVAVAAVPIARRPGTTPSAVVGAGAGTTLLVAAALALAAATF